VTLLAKPTLMPASTALLSSFRAAELLLEAAELLLGEFLPWIATLGFAQFEAAQQVSFKNISLPATVSFSHCSSKRPTIATHFKEEVLQSSG
jgi:hypothetical protein